MILTDADLAALTRRQKCSAQRRELDHMGVPYRVRRDGSLLVLWADVSGADRRNISIREPQLHL